MNRHTVTAVIVSRTGVAFFSASRNSFVFIGNNLTTDLVICGE